MLSFEEYLELSKSNALAGEDGAKPISVGLNRCSVTDRKRGSERWQRVLPIFRPREMDTLLFHARLRARFLDRSIKMGSMWGSDSHQSRKLLEEVNVFIACNLICFLLQLCLFHLRD